ISHENMMSVLSDCALVLAQYLTGRDETVLSFLPFSHILGKVESMSIYTFGWKQAFNEHLDKLMTNFTEIRPTLVFAVPRIFEKALAQIQANVEKESSAKKRLFVWALKAGGVYFSKLNAGKKPSIAERAQYLAAKTFIFRNITQRFGGRLKFCICGGAPLSSEIAEFFQTLGVSILEGYGLTETCAPVTLNTPHAYRFGTVGKPLPEVSIKSSADGELLVRSKKVFQGYFKIPDETNQVLADGWLHTGDVGFVDAEGYVHITDRKKDLIITSSGKNIAPQKLENLVKSNNFISHFVVCGERRNYLTALVTLNHEEAIQFAFQKQILFSDYNELIRHPKIISQVQEIVDELNQGLASFETIKRFLILPSDFSVENGELTPSLKVRRRIIGERYHGQIDNMYQNRG
ncbi:MAG: AMP-dependent synthetase/ligase, partial [Bdellovibrionota bacterium]